MSKKNLGSLLRYWLSWESTIAPLIRNRGAARLLWPPTLTADEENEGKCTVVRLKRPIVIYNAPQKASSSRLGVSHRHAIFIDGTFTLSAEEHPLVGATCSVSIYNIEEGPGQSVTLDLLDAMHFDMEDFSDQKAFHPILHAQRGSTNLLTDIALIDLVREITHVPKEKIKIAPPKVLGSPYIRLPTPQLDCFSVLTLVIADFFCNGGDQSPQVRTHFAAILKLLTDDRNIIRQGVSTPVTPSFPA